MKVFLLLLVLASGCVTVDAATVCTISPCHVRSGKAFSVSANHNGVNTTGYRLYMNSVVYLTQPVSALQNGVVTFAFPSINRGTYSATITAVGDGGESVLNPGIVIMATPSGN
jgi:hypothetical protein